MSEGPEVSTLEYSLPRELDLLAAESLKEAMLNMLNQSGELILDASSVERVSTPCIEVIFATGTAFTDADRKFRICNSSQYFNDALQTLGLDDHFKCWRDS